MRSLIVNEMKFQSLSMPYQPNQSYDIMKLSYMDITIQK